MASKSQYLLKSCLSNVCQGPFVQYITCTLGLPWEEEEEKEGEEEEEDVGEEEEEEEEEEVEEEEEEGEKEDEEQEEIAQHREGKQN